MKKGKIARGNGYLRSALQEIDSATEYDNEEDEEDEDDEMNIIEQEIEDCMAVSS